MSADQDFSHLSVEEKISHSIWKVRLEGYNALVAQFDASRNDQDPCFAVISSRPDILKAFVTDTNVVAQESALLALCKYLELGCPPSQVSRLKSAGIVPAICEKGLSSGRAGTKAKAVETILLLVEVSGSADWVLEQIVPYFENRLPKLVAGCVLAVHQMVENFGCSLVPPKVIIPCLSKLFAHADRNVRAETTKLTVALYAWLGDGLTSLLFPDLKPVQQRDLAAEFEKIKGSVPEQKRLTKLQKDELATRQSASSALESTDMPMEDAPGTGTPAQFDPYDMLDPIEVLSRLPADLHARMASSKWKDRVEVLEEVHAILAQAPKLANDDYTDLVRIFAKCMKDANIQVVQLAANGVEFLAKGLMDSFHKYRTLVLAPLIERSKEKKPAVADALANALDAIFACCGLGEVLEETLVGMKHKTPQVKISATHFLQRCLISTTTAPRSSQVDVIMEVGVKLLSDSQEPIRQAATDMIGTLMKITGERELRPFLEKVDENRMSKVKAVFDKVSVQAARKQENASLSSTSANTKSSPATKLGGVPVLRKPTSSQSIPSKRLATSPAKRVDVAARAPVKSLTGKSLISPTVNGMNKPLPRQTDMPKVATSAHEETIRKLKEENRHLHGETERLLKGEQALAESLRLSNDEILFLKEKLEVSEKDNTNGNLMLKQKDTQIARLSSDLENAKLKIKSLEQTIEMMKLQQSTAQPQPLPSFQRNLEIGSPFRSPERYGSQSKITQSELSSRVNRLSIDGVHNSTTTDNSNVTNSSEAFASSSRAGISDRTNYAQASDGGSEEESWKKAAEVTAQLKARIEKMKQRNRLSSR